MSYYGPEPKRAVKIKRSVPGGGGKKKRIRSGKFPRPKPPTVGEQLFPRSRATPS